MNFDLKIEELDGLIGKEEFDRRFFSKQKPVLFRNLVTHLNSDLSLSMLEHRYGSVKVPYYDNRNPKHHQGAVVSPDGHLSLRDFIVHIRREEHTHIRIFLLDLFKEVPELQEHFSCPHFFKNVMDAKAFWFFGGRNTEVKVHYDIDCSAVLMVQFSGRKRVVLVSPEYSDCMYRLPLNVHSLAGDLTDEKKFPALSYIHAYKIDMQPGDALFMPPKFWHYNTYLEPGFAISYRRLSPNPLHWLEGVVNLGIRMPLDKLLLGVGGEHWFRRKQQVAGARAEERMSELALPA